MAIVRFATGLCSGVLPVALIEIDNICGNRQTKLAQFARTLGVGFGAIGTFAFIKLSANLPDKTNEDPVARDSSMYFYPFCFVSILAWIAVMVMLLGLRLRSRTAYSQLAEDDDDILNFMPQTQNDLQSSPRSSSSLNTSSTSSSESGSPMAAAVAHVKSAFGETFNRTAMGLGLKKAMASPANLTAINLLATPQPHFRLIRGILPHHFHGYTSDGHLIVWDFVGRVKMDRLHAACFTTADLRDHYRFFFAFAQEKFLRTPNQKIVYIVDLDGLSLRDVDARAVDIACAIVKTLQFEFPDRLQALAVLNAPVWFSQVMTGIRPHLAKRTADKISFLSKKTATHDLISLVGIDSLPQRYGGRNGVEISKSAQERALDDLLRRTTASLERTIEIVGTPRSGRGNMPLSRDGSVRSDEESDEEAFFDCSEYGLQGVEDLEDQEPLVSVIVHSHENLSSKTETISRISAGSSGAYQALEKKPMQATMAAENLELAITREPLACLVLLVYFFWLLVQQSFDELIPLWFFLQSSINLGGSVHAEPPISRSTVSSITLTIAGALASLSLVVLLGQIVSNIICRSARNVMTPLATLRLGLLLQIPILISFPLIQIFFDEPPLSWIVVVSALAMKQLVAGVASHGIMTLIDNSIAVNRRLAVHRSAQRACYASHFISSGAPALFALLAYFEQVFPFDQSLLCLVQALGLLFLLIFSVAIPSRLNFPVLFSMGKR
ncbi:Phosphatidylinositol transfer protein SEC14 and related proteins [Plasmopara halstedii]|uniref:Phosphatidylinositol transfer protein SEC14 and related proteins n=1 Tax=Plasmopara halstedii TaxID=4781 RepID=A0A0P1A8Y3_PLAHL|nr:Phosphatidylinositol transfer protein SEC14 and related proteins [Plasmopara halstedii]CEG36704.1 Phosphatidylinositol transfer protein SEC14 and related proteins [Plasmopara halstedii]|eukprot:XP_024573073.1 Phosphatidylinositol transfer protein SEC14 and related proteins [Plasmopara halstedii]